MNTYIIDFRQVRPQHAYDTSGTAPMQMRLSAQVWPNDESRGRVVDCCRCEAMELSPRLPVISMSDLAFGRVPQGVTEAQAEEAARIFALNLRQEIGDVELVCMIPDVTSDFELSTVRNQLKANFSSVDFLPVSIGVVIDWVVRTDHEVADKELVVVADATPEGIQLTPVHAIYDKVSERMVWERHPGKLIPAESFFEKIREKIKDWHFPEQFFDFPGWNGLASEAGKLTLLHGDHWYDLQEQLTTSFSGLPINRNDLEPHISELAGGLTDREPTLLCATELLSWAKMAPSQLCSACDGGCTWAARQHREPETVQWYDYLPELSIEVMRKGRFELFPLVSRENRRIEPRRGKAVELHIPNRFTIPAGAKSCSFPLFRGNGGSALRFTAEVHASSFPLRKKEECRLKLTYTYGDPKPYRLTFEGSFGTANTTWQPVPEPNPDIQKGVPAIARNPYSVSVLSNFPTPSAPAEKINLLKSVLNALTADSSLAAVGSYKKWKITSRGTFCIHVLCGTRTVICPASQFFEPFPINIRQDDKVFIHRVQQTKTDKGEVILNGIGVTFSAPLDSSFGQPPPYKRIPHLLESSVVEYVKSRETGRLAWMKVNQRGMSVFCPSSALTYYPDGLPTPGNKIFCAVVGENNKGKVGGFVSLVQPSVPKNVNPIYVFYSEIFPQLFWMMPRLYFHRKSNSGLPKPFVEKLKRRFSSLMALSRNQAMESDEGQRTVVSLMSFLGADAPPEVRNKMTETMEKVVCGQEMFPNCMSLAMLIGDIEVPWQRKMFALTCDCLEHDSAELRNAAMRVCALVLNNHCLVSRLNSSEIERILHAAGKGLNAIRLELQRQDLQQEQFSELLHILANRCKLLIQLLEFRTSPSREARALLCVNSVKCQELLAIVKDINNSLMDWKGNGMMLEDKLVLAPSAYEGMYKRLYTLYTFLIGGNEAARVTMDDDLDDAVDYDENDDGENN